MTLNTPSRSTSEMSMSILKSKKKVTLKLNGYSMYPFIKPGDVGTISECSISSLKIGEIIVFKHHNNWIAHRLLKKRLIDGNHLLIAKGDTSKKNDKPISEAMFIGRLAGLSRSGRVINLESKKRNITSFLIARTATINSPFFILVKEIAKILQRN